MATVYITELKNTGGTPGSEATFAQVATWPPIAEQTVALSGVSASSATFNAQTTMIRVAGDSVFSFSIGSAPTATTTNARQPANTIEYIGLTSTGLKIAVIANT